jgi:hypothetical protein
MDSIFTHAKFQDQNINLVYWTTRRAGHLAGGVAQTHVKCQDQNVFIPIVKLVMGLFHCSSGLPKKQQLLTCTLCSKAYNKAEMAVHLASESHQVLAKLTTQPKDKTKRKSGDTPYRPIEGIL